MVLYIDACTRTQSRTRLLADAVVLRLTQENGDAEVVKRPLYKMEEELRPLREAELDKRDAALDRQDYSDPMFYLAKEFAEAEQIVIAAPYWDLSFPAILKLYLERISVNGITFRYSEIGEPIGLCKAGMLYYVTTAGGEIGNFNMGYDYVKALTRGLLGVRDSQCIRAVGLDLAGVNADEVIESAVRNLTAGNCI